MDDLLPLHPAIAALLEKIDLPAEFELTPLHSGNNRVARLDTAGQRVLLKIYFQHEGDRRDRLGTEYAFSRFAWQHGLRQLARPLACDREHGLALYEFISGRKLTADEVDDSAMRQAIDFVDKLNQHGNDPEAAALAPASEACFSLAEHLDCIERRVQRLSQISGETPIDREARRFAETEVAPAWQRLREALPADASPSDHCISPSDFGFHNAILPLTPSPLSPGGRGERGEGARLRFIDFEYAGWDDPAKLVCDFFCQPQVPVPLSFCHGFVTELETRLHTSDLRKRVEQLLPVYRMKWVCIILNEFLPVAGRRRSFAQPALDADARKAEQLRKARARLAEVAVPFHL